MTASFGPSKNYHHSFTIHSFDLTYKFRFIDCKRSSNLNFSLNLKNITFQFSSKSNQFVFILFPYDKFFLIRLRARLLFYCKSRC